MTATTSSVSPCISSPHDSPTTQHALGAHDAPRAIGPYSPALQACDWLFCSGQIPLDPKTGQLIQGDISEQTHRALKNLGAVLKGAGANFQHLVKVTIFLIDMKDFAAVNKVYSSYLKQPYPARSTIAVAALPAGSKVEIEALAYLPKASTSNVDGEV